MLMKQISAFIENKSGRLAEVTGILAKESINIHALSIADTTDFGILRMIVSDPEKAKKALKDNGLTVKTTDVAAVYLEHTPGSLYKTLKELEALDINIEYMYAFTSRLEEHDAMVILRFGNQEEALAKIEKSSIKLVNTDVIEKLNDLQRS